MPTMIPIKPPGVLPDDALTWKIDWSDRPTDRRHVFRPVTPGPWTGEPDKAQWVDRESGLDCLIVRGPMGALCGYVGVPNDHPLYGKPYDEVDVQVHGGLTFGETCQGEGDEPEPGICHVPLDGRPHDVFWFGFDCAHAFDLAPGMRDWEEQNMPPDLRPSARKPLVNPGEAVSDLPWTSKYRDFAYVVSECRSLAYQLSAVSV